MVSKGSKAYSIVKMKCPRCQEGDFFKGKNPYSSEGLKMHEKCSNCHLRYDVEPGFYFGAMYISYMFGVALTIPTEIVLYLLFPDAPIHYYIIFGLIELMALMPAMYRLSRIVWINFFISFEKDSLKS